MPSEAVEQGLRKRIAAGEWQPGEQLPSTEQLADQYRTSKETCARVLRKLAGEGLVIIRDRWGSFLPE
jgi:DNA-binding GntR family transcriptional regulator